MYQLDIYRKDMYFYALTIQINMNHKINFDNLIQEPDYLIFLYILYNLIQASFDIYHLYLLFVILLFLFSITNFMSAMEHLPIY